MVVLCQGALTYYRRRKAVTKEGVLHSTIYVKFCLHIPVKKSLDEFIKTQMVLLSLDHTFYFCCLLVFAVLVNESRALYMLGKHFEA